MQNEQLDHNSHVKDHNSHVKVDIMGKEGEDEQEGFLTALLILPTGREVVLMADAEPSYMRGRADTEKFIETARAEARKLGAGFDLGFDLDDEFKGD